MSDLDTQLTIRVSEATRNAFVVKCQKMNRRYSDMLREFMEAFNKDNLTIKRNPNHPAKGLYQDDH